MSRDLVILGAGGGAKEVIECAEQIRHEGQPAYHLRGILDDDGKKWGTELAGQPILGGLGEAHRFPDALFVNVIYGTRLIRRRREIMTATGIPPERMATLIHPTAVVSRMAKLGHGTVILANAVVGADAEVGNHVMILPNVTINHDVILEDYCLIASGVNIAGYTRVRESSYIGSGSVLQCRLQVGPRALVGMGSVVLKDVAPETVVAGNPARVLRPL